MLAARPSNRCDAANALNYVNSSGVWSGKSTRNRASRCAFPTPICILKEETSVPRYGCRLGASAGAQFVQNGFDMQLLVKEKALTRSRDALAAAHYLDYGLGCGGP